MNDDPNQYTVLGTLVDRAVCMPYSKPQVLRRGQRRYKDDDGPWRSVATVREDVAASSAFLVECLQARGARAGWSKAALALDPAGPWWAKSQGDFFALSAGERAWVLDRLEDTADRAAGAIEEEAIGRKWSWLWSQASLAKPGKLRPSITRPDLLGGMDWKRCDLVDLKTTAQSDLRTMTRSGQEARFARWTEALTAMRFTPENRRVLVVSSVDDRWEWVEVPAGDDDEE